MSETPVQTAPETDYRALLGLSRRHGAMTREGYAAIRRQLFSGEPSELTDRERALMTNLIRRIIAGIDAAVRSNLAVGLATLEEFPASVVNVVERAGAVVTYGRLVNSGMLEDDDLIEAVVHRTLEFQLENALRKRAGGQWSAAELAGESGLVASLAPDADQTVVERLNAYMVHHAMRIDTYEEPVLPLDELDGELVNRLFWAVSAVLRGIVLEAGDVDEAVLDATLEEVVRKLTAPERPAESATARVETAVDGLAEAGLLNPSFLVDAVGNGEIQLSQALLARLAGLRPVLVRRLMFESDGSGLAIAGKAIDMDRSEFSDLYRLMRSARRPSDAGESENVNSVVSMFDRIPHDEAVKVLEYWRRPQDYLRALWQYERWETGQPPLN